MGSSITVLTSPPSGSGAPESLKTNVLVDSVPRTLVTGKTILQMKTLWFIKVESIAKGHEVN